MPVRDVFMNDMTLKLRHTYCVIQCKLKHCTAKQGVYVVFNTVWC